MNRAIWSRPGFGILCGLTMSVGGGVAFAFARAGIRDGFTPVDLIALRFAVAGLFAMPWLLAWGWRDLGGLGWRRAILLTAGGGPPFALMQTGGFAFAPLAHGALIAPATVTIGSTIVAGLLLHERLGVRHVIGAGLALSGLVLISWHGLTLGSAGAQAWIGDLLFAASSLLWIVYTVQVRRWKVDAVRATAAVAVLSMFAILPVYLAWRGPGPLMAMPLRDLVVQGFVQGLIQALLTIMAFTRAVAILGVSRAVLFPALVPAFAFLVGIPVAGEIPTGVQWAGLALVTTGLVVAVAPLARRPAASAAG